eukprot:TRINITY_DN59240_c0_g2_i1.p1 TRINITY_DN59240_c0_g2~~TRINITY_DN59240_c0_g2_i1.p1  ORF type:complete len:194 (+),score=14.96 TRINITY_DN59240_c0_g2_i1:77-658(+)
MGRTGNSSYIPAVLCSSVVIGLLFFFGRDGLTSKVAPRTAAKGDLIEAVGTNRTGLAMVGAPPVGKDLRGWITNPILYANIPGFTCLDAHVGTIKPGAIRGNHQHGGKDEVLMTWGAKSFIRVATGAGAKEAHFLETEAAIIVAPRGYAHAIKNEEDPGGKDLNLLGCSSAMWDPHNPQTTENIWRDLKVDRG